MQTVQLVKLRRLLEIALTCSNPSRIYSDFSVSNKTLQDQLKLTLVVTILLTQFIPCVLLLYPVSIAYFKYHVLLYRKQNVLMEYNRM